jgi:hypothetical protein
MFFNQNIYFKDDDVADLAWVIGSPPLMDDAAANGQYAIFGEEWYHTQFNLHLDWLKELDVDPTPLKDWLQQEDQKLLGKRFESLLAFWLAHSPSFELLHRNVVFHNEHNNTSGEADFIVKEKESNEVWHIEAACKYYLAHDKSHHWKNWIGPNGHDTLELKMSKVYHQLRIFDKAEGKRFLKEHDLPKPNSFLWMKGYFFHHYRLLEGAVPPKDAHRHYGGGWYIYEHELPLFKSDFAQWLLLPKERWISRVHLKGEVAVLSGNEMIEHVRQFIRKHAKAVMIVQVEDREESTVEVSRGFVVRDAWPHF